MLTYRRPEGTTDQPVELHRPIADFAHDADAEGADSRACTAWTKTAKVTAGP